MAESGNPQFVMASNALSSASSIICAISMLVYMFLMFMFLGLNETNHKDTRNLWGYWLAYGSVYKWSMVAIEVTQSIGVVVGSIARCFTVLTFKSFAMQKRNYFLVFKVDKYCTEKLSEWKESRISFLSSGRRSKALLHNSKSFIQSFCIGLQKKKQHNNLLKLLEEFVGKSAALNGVVTFDNDQFQSPLPVEHVNSWSLPIISLTCIAVVISDIRQARVDNLFKSVGEGLLYTHVVEETLNREAVYVNIRRATATMWHEVEENRKRLETTLERSVYQEKN
ncbi:hypothetical protein Hanom_Chr06g00509391 [Helianthus anomalus]